MTEPACANGHPQTPENLIERYERPGQFRCRLCKSEHARAWRDRHPEAVRAERAARDWAAYRAANRERINRQQRERRAAEKAAP